MGLFDRFRSTVPTDSIVATPTHAEEEATRLIEHGHTLEAQGRLDDALQCYLDAIRLAPNPARAHLNRGNVLLLKGDLEGALDAFRTAIQHKPDYAGAYYNIGNALLNQGRHEEAAANYRRALEIQPDYAEVHCVMGVALRELGQLDHALACFNQAILLNPDLVEAQTNQDHALEALFNKGTVLLTEGKPEKAILNFDLFLNHKPDHAEARNNLGHALQDLGNLDDALENYFLAIEIKPEFSEAHYNLGNILLLMDKKKEAAARFHRSLEIKPDFTEAHYNLAITLQALGQLDDALQSYRKALQLKPDYVQALHNLGNTLKELGQINNALESYRRALTYQPDLADVHSNLLLVMNYARHAPAEYLEQARQYGRRVAGKVATRFTTWPCPPHPERLRIGLVSGDFNNHPAGYFLESLLSHLDRDRIELFAYPTSSITDQLTLRIRPFFSGWKPLLGLDDAAAAQLIHADGVHILIDLSGHTLHNRLPLFAWKPAPVQVSWLGYFATTGVAQMDYLLADPVGVPVAQQDHFTETIWYLPDTRLCFTPPAVDLPVAPLPALHNGYLTFGCFQNLAKVGDEVVTAWAEILAALPGARMRLQAKQLGEPAQVEQLLARLRQHGIDPARVTTHGSMPREAYLAAHAEVDILLDTFPYPGGTTTCEALWMGVPTVTLAGDSLLARQGASLLSAAGLPGWVADSRADYVARAIDLATDRAGLAVLRAGLREQVRCSPLFDAARFARNFEAALWGMWARHETQQGAAR